MSYVPVTLHFIGKSIEFKTPDELSKFVSDEKESLDWLRFDKGAFSNFSKVFFQNSINEVFNWFTPLLNNWIDRDAPSDDVIDKINRCLAAVNFPFTHTAERNLIEEKVEKGSSALAISILYLCCAPIKDAGMSGYSRNYYEKYAKLSNVRANSSSSGEWSELAPYRVLAIAELNKISGLKIREQLEEEVETSIAEFKIKQDEISSNLLKLHKEVNDGTSKMNNHIEHGEKLLASAGGRALQKYKGYIKELRSKVKSMESDAYETVQKAQDVYLSQVELDASVKYWGDKQAAHKKSRDTWLRATIALLAFMAAIPIASHWLYSGEDFKEIPLVLGIFNPLSIVTTVILISLSSFTIRFCSRQYSTDQHLYLEAEERKTMLKTYLALMNEGKLVEQEDRKVALDALFRPAQTGIVADHGAVVPTDSVVRIIEKHAKAPSTKA
ncbi:DUF6161 domain-containing protein [Pseudoalteromonas luteoviolacea]|uniref:DUF6161 domain-containing protein n=1 Tax=Pseudoalteromonas luteoviolacea TaxID=43657 RepID=UPI001F19B83E|nr:DUF6161 domain-containing protein [Pseudoalteromonas luteoviolacea]MCF6442653.1 DUF6161 domain-containing protein [Pseudoalteromonas luteoviolacea]